MTHFTKLCLAFFSFYYVDAGWAKPQEIPFRIKIAFMAAFSSNDPTLVLTTKNLDKGIATFFDQHPDAKDRLELVRFDNGGDPSRGPVLVDEIEKQNIRILIGPTRSKHVTVVQDKVAQARLIQFLPIATHDALTKEKPYVFRICYSDSSQGRAAALFASQHLSHGKVLISRNVDEPYSQGLVESFRSHFPPVFQTKIIDVTNGTKLPESVKRTTQDFQPDVIYVPDYAERAVLYMEALYPLKPNLIFIGSDGWGARELLTRSMERLPGIQAYYTTLWHDGVSTPLGKKFVDKYDRLFPKERESIVGAAMLYDTLSVIWTTLQLTRFQDDPGRMKNVLESTALETTVGVLRFDNPNDHTPTRKVPVVRISAKSFTLEGLY